MAFDFDTAIQAPFRMQPGLRRLAPGAPQLTPLAAGGRHQREKLAVLSAFWSQALLQEPGFDPGPALAGLADHAAREHPQAWAWDGRTAHARHLGVSVDAKGEVIELQRGRFGLGDELSRCLRQLPPGWRLTGLLSLAFAEDFAVVDGRHGTIPWLAVALPSFWAPEEKVGRHFAEVHAPVADNALLLKAADALVRTVTGPERWERFVWTLTPHTRLHAHPDRVDPARWSGIDLPTIGERSWLRTERQTFIPLPGSGQAVFTILVELQALAEATAAAGRAQTLHDALASMSPAVLDYRGLGAVREPLLHWLAERGRDRG
jgi:dimethylamine monooxygenase subunit A